MSDRPPPADDRALAARLRDLGAGLAYPPTPDLAAATRARLAAGPPRPRRMAWLGSPAPRRFALALLLLLALAGATLAVSPGARKAVAGWFGVLGLTITYGTPTTRTPATPVATPTSVGARLGLGQALPLGEARARVPFPILTPGAPDPGPPDEVYLAVPPADGQIALVWRARPDLPAAAETGVGLLLSQFRGRLTPTYWQKTLGPDVRVENPTVRGTTGFWIAGGPHQFSYADPSGRIIPQTTRLAGNVLLWEEGGVTYRLEGARTREEALRIAESLR